MKYKASAKTRKLMSEKRKAWWAKQKILHKDWDKFVTPSGRAWKAGSLDFKDVKISYSQPSKDLAYTWLGVPQPAYIKPIKFIFKQLRAIVALFNKSSGDDTNGESK